MASASLRLRVVIAGLLVLTAILLVLNPIMYLVLRAQLVRDLELVLADRVALVQELAASQVDLPAALRRIGLPATIAFADGSVQEGAPLAPQGGSVLLSEQASQRVLRSEPLALPDGILVTVQVSRLGVDRALRRLLVIQVVGSAAALLIGGVLLSEGCRRALRPLNDVVALAVRVRDGRVAGRLRPGRVDTEIGALAHAVDTMLDAQEGALAQAKASEERNRRFLADATHQLRSPVTTIQLTAETLLRARSEEERHRLLGVLLGETGRVGALFDDLLRLARLDRDSPMPSLPVDVAALVNEELRRTSGLAPNLTVSGEEAAGLTAVAVPGDQELMRAAISNLMDNARRHAASAVDVITTGTEGHLCVTVRDDGPGLPPGAEERAFERFSSLDGMGGSGLGLAIARAAARAHGGDLEYESGAFRLRFAR